MAAAELTVVDPRVTVGSSERSVTKQIPPPTEAVVGLLWNSKPNGDVALQFLGEELQTRFPGLQTRFYKGLMGSPAELLEKAAAECDVVIGCTADCGSCTSLMAKDCSDIEKMGIRTASIVSVGFEENFRLSAKSFGLEGLASVVVPYVYNNVSTDAAREQTKGIVGELVDLIWGPAQESASAEFTPRAGEVGDGSNLATFSSPDVESIIADFHRYTSAREWSDGLPMQVPTPAYVERLASAIDLENPVIGGVLPPANGFVTRELLGIAGALAGCDSVEMPVVAGLVQAISGIREPIRRIGLMSTSAHALVAVVNGPIADELGLNGGRGCIGPGQQDIVNLRIMRAAMLSLRIVGGWRLGATDMDTLGSTRKFGSLFAENAKESSWEPLQAPDRPNRACNGVTAWFSTWEQDIKFQGHTDPKQLALAIASNLGFWRLGNFSQLVGGRRDDDEGILAIISPPHAQALADGGFSKEGLARFLFEHSSVTVARVRTPLQKLYSEGRIRPEWRWMFALSETEARNRFLPAVDNPKVISIVVAARSVAVIWPCPHSAIHRSRSGLRSRLWRSKLTSLRCGGWIRDTEASQRLSRDSAHVFTRVFCRTSKALDGSSEESEVLPNDYRTDRFEAYDC